MAKYIDSNGLSHLMSLLKNYIDSTAGSLPSGTVVPIGQGGTGATTAADARTALNAVSKSGDTIVGKLSFKSNDQASPIELGATSSSANARIGHSPSSAKYWGGEYASDINGDSVWYSQMAVNAPASGEVTGNMYRSYVVRRYSSDGSTPYTHGFYVGIRPNGDPYLIFSDTPSGQSAKTAAAWRTAIGLAAYGSLTAQSSSLTLTTSAQKIPLSTFTGVECSAYSNGIKVANAGTYMVWGSCYAGTGYTVDDIFHLHIYKGSSSVLDYNKRIKTANPYEVINAGPVIVTCAANDVLYLYANNQTAARGTVTSKAGVGLVVRRIG